MVKRSKIRREDSRLFLNAPLELSEWIKEGMKKTGLRSSSFIVMKLYEVMNNEKKHSSIDTRKL